MNGVSVWWTTGPQQYSKAPWVASSHLGQSWEPSPSPASLLGPAQKPPPLKNPQPVGACCLARLLQIQRLATALVFQLPSGLLTMSSFTARPLERRDRAGQGTLRSLTLTRDLLALDLAQSGNFGWLVCMCLCDGEGVNEGNIKNLENELKTVPPTSNLILTLGVL